MRKLFFIILIGLWLQPKVVFTQSNAFVKVVSKYEHSPLKPQFKVIQTIDKGYVVGYFDQYYFNLQKLDSNGRLVLERKYEITNLYSSSFTGSFSECNDEGLIIATTHQSEDTIPYHDIHSYPRLIRINKYSDTIWSKIYYFDSNETSMAVTQTSDNGFALLCRRIVSLKEYIHIIKTNAEGTLEWDKLFAHDLEYNGRYDITETISSDLFIQATSVIVKLNSKGDLIWNKKFSSLSFASSTIDSGYICTGINFLMKLDKDANKQWQTNFNKRGNAVYQLKDKSLIVSTDQGLLKTNEIGDSIWLKKYGFYLTNVLPAKDDGFILSTDYLGYYSIIKVKSDGSFDAMGLIPNYGPILTVNNEYTISWISDRVYKINLDYSVDGGNNWTNIISDVQDSGKYIWKIPFVVSDKCRLRISNQLFPTIFYPGDTTFIISPNNSYDYISVNQIKMWIKNNGDGSHDPFTDGQGLYWPGSVNATMGASFEDGFLWGGKINGEIRVNGNTHRQGITSGKILSDGKAGEPIPIWKIKNNWQSLPSGSERDRYQFNFENWPGDLGAPFIDVDKDNKFTNGIDQPGFLGDEVMWFAANDLDTLTSLRTYGSNPIGLEIQVTTFGYDKQDDLADVVFKKYKIINKSGKQIEDMYLAYWADPDLGDGNDDFAGCDTTLNLGYVYNATNNDLVYGMNPPAIGYQFVQGPAADGNSLDSARINDNWRKGKKNLPMTAFSFYIGANSVYLDPNQGQYSGTLEFYNNMQGLIWTGDKVIDPITSLPIKYVLPGDPVSEVGWFEGKGWPNGFSASDRRLLISSGPFNMAPADTQEIVLAIIMARGTDNINSVSELKRKAKFVQEFYDSHIPTTMEDKKALPIKFELHQNYPNPFNPSTMISYQLPVNSNVTLKLFDVLGKEVATLLNEKQNKGIHHYPLSIMNYKLSSGVYFYQLKAGEYLGTKKMMLLK